MAILVGTAGARVRPLRVVVRPKTFETLAAQPSSMKTLIEGYGAALEQSRLRGRAVRLVVDVGRRGTAKVTSLDTLSHGATEPAAPGGDIETALSAARERGRRRVAEILSAKDMLSADEFADLIGTTRVTVHAKRQARQVLGLEGAKRGYRFPEWQIGQDGKPFAALPDLFRRLGNNSWAVYRFLVQHHPELDRQTGLEALQKGRVTEVLDTAEAVARGDFA